MTKEVEVAKSQLIKMFKDYQEWARKWRQGGKKVFGYFCSYVPEEILYAAQILPIRILGSPEPVDQADSHIQSYVCRLIRSSLNKGIKGGYDYMDGVIIPYTCDGMRLLHDLWEINVNNEFVWLLDIPSSTRSDAGKRFFFEAIDSLKTAVETYTGREIQPEDLDRAIYVHNETQSLLGTFYRYRRNSGWEIGSEEALQMTLAALVSPKEEYNQRMAALLKAFANVSNEGAQRVGTDWVRLHVSGSVSVDPKLYRLIDQAGGMVVSDDLCTGSRYFWDKVGVMEDPLLAIKKRYLNRISCPSKYPAADRREYLLSRIQESGSQGVIFLLEKYCDPHLFDYPGIQTALEEKGIQSLWLETELFVSGEEQVKTRIEAFIEMIKRNRRQ